MVSDAYRQPGVRFSIAVYCCEEKVLESLGYLKESASDFLSTAQDRSGAGEFLNYFPKEADFIGYLVLEYQARLRILLARCFFSTLGLRERGHPILAGLRAEKSRRRNASVLGWPLWMPLVRVGK
jgi:hypothetical protein